MTKAGAELDVALRRLSLAVGRRRSSGWRHRLWSRFVRLRDGRCLGYGASENLTAHHIFRRSVVSIARFDTGNGITLCRRCHRTALAVFNRRPRVGDPLNASGGDDLDLIGDAYGLLVVDARSRGLLRDDHCFVSDALLDWLQAAQGVPDAPLSGCRLERAEKPTRIAPTGFRPRESRTFPDQLGSA